MDVTAAFSARHQTSLRDGKNTSTVCSTAHQLSDLGRRWPGHQPWLHLQTRGSEGRQEDQEFRSTRSRQYPTRSHGGRHWVNANIMIDLPAVGSTGEGGSAYWMEDRLHCKASQERRSRRLPESERNLASSFSLTSKVFNRLVLGRIRKSVDIKLREGTVRFPGREVLHASDSDSLHHHRIIARMGVTVACQFCWL